MRSIEGLYDENVHTISGTLEHENAHDASRKESRPGILIRRALRVHSASLGVSGECDVVEFYAAPKGVSLSGQLGFWTPYPVEYKHGDGRYEAYDSVQLCCQAMCLEEMLCCSIPEGALFYQKIRRRKQVLFDESLRDQVRSALSEMHQLKDRNYTPKVKKKAKACRECSLYELCMPKLMDHADPGIYYKKALDDLP